MSVIYVLVPLAVLLVIAFVWAYAWSTKTGQFDDLTTPAIRMLHDDVARPVVGTRVPRADSPDGEPARDPRD